MNFDRETKLEALSALRIEVEKLRIVRDAISNLEHNEKLSQILIDQLFDLQCNSKLYLVRSAIERCSSDKKVGYKPSVVQELFRQCLGKLLALQPPEIKESDQDLLEAQFWKDILTEDMIQLAGIRCFNFSYLLSYGDEQPNPLIAAFETPNQKTQFEEELKTQMNQLFVKEGKKHSDRQFNIGIQVQSMVYATIFGRIVSNCYLKTHLKIFSINEKYTTGGFDCGSSTYQLDLQIDREGFLLKESKDKIADCLKIDVEFQSSGY